MVDIPTDTDVSDEAQAVLTIAILTSFAVVVGGLFLGRLDIAFVGVVALAGSAWILGQLSMRGDADD